MPLRSSTPRPTRTAAPTPDLALDVSVRSDVGCVRAVNEDDGRFVRPGTPAQRSSHGLLALVADGMGGHDAGDVASRLAVDGIAASYYTSPPPSDPHQALETALESANRTVHKTATDQQASMGTTCVALVLRDGRAFAAHVGDSRCYRLRGDRLEALTQDHSVVGELVARGLLTSEQARLHEERHLITRALGLHETVEVDTWSAPLSVEEGDVFLLSTDGLHDLLHPAEIQAALSVGSAALATERLIDRARALGGPDNITTVVIRVEPPRPPRATRPTRPVSAEA
ncbi:MAG: PP2C family serine/threonine-protein phosphatase [Bacteroidota bacterium]